MELLTLVQTHSMAATAHKIVQVTKLGYAWAQEHDIGDGNACDAAGEHSNSPSFAEGCHAYVNDDADTEDSATSDSNSEDPGESRRRELIQRVSGLVARY